MSSYNWTLGPRVNLFAARDGNIPAWTLKLVYIDPATNTYREITASWYMPQSIMRDPTNTLAYGDPNKIAKITKKFNVTGLTQVRIDEARLYDPSGTCVAAGGVNNAVVSAVGFNEINVTAEFDTPYPPAMAPVPPGM